MIVVGSDSVGSRSIRLSGDRSRSKDEEDFCRFWSVAGRDQQELGQFPTDACLLMNRASMAVDLGSSQMLLLPRLPPPPPVPPTLTELVNQLNQLGQLQQHR